MTPTQKKGSTRTWLLFGGAGAIALASAIILLWPRTSTIIDPTVSAKPVEPAIPVIPHISGDPEKPQDPPTPKIAEPQPPAPPQRPAVQRPVERPKVDVVFVLDTTGSMGGLLEGAKKKIWSIASHIATGKPTPELRVGLVAYRDRGDAYVTKVFPLTSNLDEVYGNLQGFRAAGGGDEPEDVKQALMDGIRKMSWTPGKNLRLMFLVGDAPAHEDYDDQPSMSAITAEATQKGIIINTVRCGGSEVTAASWKAIAQASGGDFSSIAQDGGMMAAVHTPMDARLGELNAKLSGTAVYVGTAPKRAAAAKRAETNSAMEGSLKADSARYRAMSGHVDSDDLVTQVALGKARIEDVSEEALPEPMQAMSVSERKAYVADQKAERERLSAEVIALSKERDEYLRRSAPASPKKGSASFDAEVGGTISKQAKKVGISYKAD